MLGAFLTTIFFSLAVVFANRSIDGITAAYQRTIGGLAITAAFFIVRSMIRRRRAVTSCCC